MKRKKQEEWWLWVILSIILVISILTLSKYSESNYVYKQIFWIILGILSVFVIKKFKIKLIFLYSNWIYIGNVILLILVLLVGKEINGARAWFDFKYFSFQPSEFMKISLALYLTKIITITNPHNIKEEFLLISRIGFVFILPSILVFLQPDTGAIILYFVITLVALYYAKINRKWFILLFGFVGLISGIFFGLYFQKQSILINLIGTSFFYRVDRLISFANNTGYQLSQALIAIGSAGLWGNNTTLYIPEAITDFIFAFMISKLGLIMGFIVLLCYFILDIYFIKIINKTNLAFIAMFLFMFLFQQIQNILMNIGLLPIMGIPLPFLSYGGTNTIIYFLFLGIILKIKNVRNFTF